MIQGADPNPLIEDESSLAARAAWLHHIGRLTRNEVAARLNLPTGKAHRLIARAGREGMVRVFVDGAIARCMQLEQRLCRAYGLSFCEIAPEVDEEPLPLRSLGVLGARYLRLACERGQDPVSGLSSVAWLKPRSIWLFQRKINAASDLRCKQTSESLLRLWPNALGLYRATAAHRREDDPLRIAARRLHPTLRGQSVRRHQPYSRAHGRRLTCSRCRSASTRPMMAP